MKDIESFKEIMEQEIIVFMNCNYTITFNLYDDYKQVIKFENQGDFGLTSIEHFIALFKSRSQKGICIYH